MILSSADIQRILGGDPIIRQEARISIVGSKPGFGLDEYVYIYIERYPAVDEFEATWRIWVQNGGSDVLDLVLAAMTRLLPKFEFQREGLYSTTDFKSDRTVVRPAEEIALEKVAQATGTIEQRFAALEQLILARLAAIRNGIDGQDGLDGPVGAPGAPGRDGRDGRDLVATEADLEDLQNVEQNIAKQDGQVLTWKDGVWQNLFIPQVVGTIGGGGGGGGIEEAPIDGNFYVRQDGAWVNLVDALEAIQEQQLDDLDAGDFTTGVTSAANSISVDGGNLTTGVAETTVTTDFDGGEFVP